MGPAESLSFPSPVSQPRMQNGVADRSSPNGRTLLARLRDLVHSGIVVGGRSSLSGAIRSRGGAVGLTTAEVVLHLSIELLGGLGLGLASTAGLFLVVAGVLRGALGAVGGGLGGLRGSALLALLSGVLRLTLKLSVLE